jgi:glycosyltransferase involved in cell wall biosynthesis
MEDNDKVGSMNAKPVILQLIGSDFYGSPERLILGQMQNLSSFDFVCASFVKPHVSSEILSIAGSQGHCVESIQDNHLFDPRIPLRITDIIKKHGVRLVVSHGYKANTYGYLSSRKIRIPQVAYFHGWTQEDLKMRLYNMIDRLVLPKLSAIIAVSGASANSLVAHGVSREKIRVVYNALDIGADQTLPRRSPKEHPTLAVIGRLSHEKGVHIFIRAVASIAYRTESFTAQVYGDGIEMENMRRLADELKVSHIVRFEGFSREIDKVYNNLDFLVIPSLSEGHPLVILEAWKHGVGVIASRAGGIPEVIDHRVNGILVETGNHLKLGEAIVEALDHREEMNAFGKAGFVKLKDKFNTNIYYQRLTEIYGSLLR